MKIYDAFSTLGGYALDRMSEASTWQGIGFIVSLSGAKWGMNLAWGEAAAVGGLVSGAIKTLAPDIFKPKASP